VPLEYTTRLQIIARRAPPAAAAERVQRQITCAQRNVSSPAESPCSQIVEQGCQAGCLARPPDRGNQMLLFADYAVPCSGPGFACSGVVVRAIKLPLRRAKLISAPADDTIANLLPPNMNKH